MFLLKDTMQGQWGSNLRPLGLESSTLPLSHCAPNRDFDYHKSGHDYDKRMKHLLLHTAVFLHFG